MQELEQLPVLRVGDESISLAQSLKYLQLSGNLMPVNEAPRCKQTGYLLKTRLAAHPYAA